MDLNNLQLDAIKEIINMGTGKAASILNQMFTTRVLLKIPEISFVEASKIDQVFKSRHKEYISFVNLDFNGNFSGTAKLIFPTESASKLVQIFAEEENDEEELNEIRSSTLAEIGNIVLNSLMGTISNTLTLKLNYSIPTYKEDKFNAIVSYELSGIEPYLFLAHTNFTLDEYSITGDFILVFEIGSLDEFISHVDVYIKNLDNND